MTVSPHVAPRLAAACLLLILFSASPRLLADPLGDAFTYQGFLADQGVPANGDYDFQIGLADAVVAGNILDTVQLLSVPVAEGVFTLELDFGSDPFAGEARWLNIAVRPAGEPAFTELSPRQALTPTPMALFSKKVGVDSVGAPQVLSDEVQLRVIQSCFGGASIASIGADGSVTCSPDETGTWIEIDPTHIWTPADWVGINFDKPEATLHVADAGSTHPAIFVEGASASEGDISWPPGEILQLGTWEPARAGFERRMQIDTSGTVWIDQDLVFESLLGDKISLFGDRIGQDSMYGFGVAENVMYYKANGAHSWLIANNSGAPPEMHLTATGLGIGTSVPNHELVVQGNEPAVQIRDDGVDNAANAARLELLEQAGGNYDGGAFFWWNGELDRLYIGTKTGGVNTNQLVIDRSSSSVGIGTQNIDTNHRLSVNGSIRAKELVVETGWSDFVFEDHYVLRPLHEVAAFIDANGHLPDVPSAAEVARDGVAVGAMEAILLQKIEELTLYTLELNARIGQLEAQLTGRQP